MLGVDIGMTVFLAAAFIVSLVVMCIQDARSLKEIDDWTDRLELEEPPSEEDPQDPEGRDGTV